MSRPGRLYFCGEDTILHCLRLDALTESLHACAPLLMRLYYLEREQWVPAPLEKIFNFFSRPENLQKLTPPWLDLRIVEAPAELAAGALIRYRLRWHFLPIRWSTEIADWSPPHKFVDRAVSGPYALWNHEHSFESYKAARACTIVSLMRFRWGCAGPSPIAFG